MQKKLLCIICAILCITLVQTGLLAAGQEEGSSMSTAARLEEMGFSQTGWPITREPTRLRVFFSIIPEQSIPMEKMSIIQKVQEATNIEVEWINVQDVNLKQKVNLMFASNDLPDLFWDGLTIQEAYSYAGQELVMPLDDLIDNYTVTIKEMIDETEGLRETITSPDGKIYTLFRFGNAYHQDMGPMLYINREWLKQAGMEIPRTLADYEAYMRFVKSNDMNGDGNSDDEIPFGYCFYTKNSNWSELPIFGAFGLNMDNSDTVNFLNLRNGKVGWGPAGEEFKETIKWLSEMYAAGLIDQEAYIHDKAQMKAKGNQQPPIYGSYVSWFNMNVGGANGQFYDIVGPLEGPTGKKVSMARPRSLMNAGPGVITSSCELPEVAIRWLDYVYQPEINVQLAYGAEGEAMKKHSDGRWEILPPPEGQTAELFRMLYSPHHPPMTFPQYLTTIDPPHFQEKDRAKRELYNPHYPSDQILPVFYFDQSTQEEVDAILPDLVTFAQQKWAEWVMIGNIDEEWDSYIARIEQMGLSRVLELYQKGYEAMKNNR